MNQSDKKKKRKLLNVVSFCGKIERKYRDGGGDFEGSSFHDGRT